MIRVVKRLPKINNLDFIFRGNLPCADLLFELKDEGSKLKRSKLDSADFCAAFNVVDDSHPCLSFSSRMRFKIYEKMGTFQSTIIF
ncbi:unnamed protein product [Schistosoma curassoni]|uniref:Uncharacterized protein n=1 Tax=Schistosoma curassoni TaxID=6186 RepID=A0A183JVI4_9TREM|nr:unnamed protein product [Schistosoma curassoni]